MVGDDFVILAQQRANPFAQPAHPMEIIFILPAHQVPKIESAFDDVSLSQASTILDSKAGIWETRLLVEGDLSQDVARRLAILKDVYGETFPEPTIQSLEERDWVSDVQASFKPMQFGRFYVYGSHIEQAPPLNKIGIVMDAGAAFGTGEHGTTSSCMAALEWLSKQHHFRRILDMGTGTGILAIAAAKLWSAHEILAVDLDPVAVRVAQRNMVKNDVATQVRVAYSAGYKSRHVAGCYDLVIANILAKPLILMAKDLRKHLAMGGFVILSGLLQTQEKRVLSVHRALGMQLVKRWHKEGWSALVLRG